MGRCEIGQLGCYIGYMGWYKSIFMVLGDMLLEIDPYDA